MNGESYLQLPRPPGARPYTAQLRARIFGAWWEIDAEFDARCYTAKPDEPGGLDLDDIDVMIRPADRAVGGDYYRVEFDELPEDARAAIELEVDKVLQAESEPYFDDGYYLEDSHA